MAVLLLAATLVPLTSLPASAESSAAQAGDSAAATRQEQVLDSNGFTAVRAVYREVIEALLPGMGADDPLERRSPQSAFERICLAAARPGSEAQRRALAMEILPHLDTDTPLEARVWLIRQLEYIGRDEAVGTLAALFQDGDARIRECARRALVRNPSSNATTVLRLELQNTIDADWTIALMNALAHRREGSSAAVIAEYVDHDDPRVAAAAIAALADFTGSSGVARLMELWNGNDETRRRTAAQALLRIAGGLNERGAAGDAWAIYEALSGGPSHDTPAEIRIAALCGMARAGGQDALPKLLSTIRDATDERLRLTAARLLEPLELPALDETLIAEAPKAAPATRAVLIDVLGQRNSKAARRLALDGLVDPAAEVRLAALRALEHIGIAGDVEAIAGVGGRAAGSERDAARQALALLPGSDVNEAILAAVGRATAPETRTELVRALADRHARETVPRIFALAADDDPQVRSACYEALAELAQADSLPNLVALLSREQDADALAVAEDAVVKLTQPLGAEDVRSAAVLDAFSASESGASSKLIRLLGRIQGRKALERVRAALNHTDPEMQDAAVRALARWNTVEALDDLGAIARENADPSYRVLALRGYIRLLRLPSERPADQTFALLKGAMHIAEQPNEKRQVLSALTEIGQLGALDYARAFLADAELRDEAAVTTISLARALLATNSDEAAAALDAVRAAGVGQAAQKSLDELDEFTRRFAGYIAAWDFAGPFKQDGKKMAALADTPFPPEAPASDDVQWRPIGPGRRDNPWIYDFAGDSECCAYVRTKIVSVREQAAMLEIGSDDGIKAWLNGEVVLRNPAFRSIEPATDKVPVTLNKGENVLLLKILQGSGGWGFTCGVKSPDGGAIEGLRFETCGKGSQQLSAGQ